MVCACALLFPLGIAFAAMPPVNTQVNVQEVRNTKSGDSVKNHDTSISCNSYHNFTSASDTVIIIDDSQSFGEKSFNKSKSIFKKLLKVHNLGDAGTHLAVITFAGKASTKFNFIGAPEPSWCELCHEGGRWEREVKYTHMKGETGLRDAIDLARDILLKPRNRTQAKKRVWLATDFHDFHNKPEIDLRDIFTILRVNDIELYGVGLGGYLRPVNATDNADLFKQYVNYVNNMTSADCHYRDGDDWLNIDPLYHFRPDKDDLIDIKDPETLMCGCDPCKCRVYDDQGLYDDHGRICDKSYDGSEGDSSESSSEVDSGGDNNRLDDNWIIAIGAGVGGGLLLLVIVILIVCVVKRNNKPERRRPLPRLTTNTGTSTSSIHDASFRTDITTLSSSPSDRTDITTLSSNHSEKGEPHVYYNDQTPNVLPIPPRAGRSSIPGYHAPPPPALGSPGHPGNALSQPGIGREVERDQGSCTLPGRGQRGVFVVEDSNGNSVLGSPGPTPPQAIPDLIRGNSYMTVLGSDHGYELPGNENSIQNGHQNGRAVSTHSYESMNGWTGEMPRSSTQDDGTQTTVAQRFKQFRSKVSNVFDRRTSSKRNKGTCTEQDSMASDEDAISSSQQGGVMRSRPRKYQTNNNGDQPSKRQSYKVGTVKFRTLLSKFSGDRTGQSPSTAENGLVKTVSATVSKMNTGVVLQGKDDRRNLVQNPGTSRTTSGNDKDLKTDGDDHTVETASTKEPSIPSGHVSRLASLLTDTC